MGVFDEGDVVVGVYICVGACQPVALHVNLLCVFVVFSVLVELLLIFNEYFSEIAHIL